jgi:hypothetical protein
VHGNLKSDKNVSMTEVRILENNLVKKVRYLFHKGKKQQFLSAAENSF